MLGLPKTNLADFGSRTEKQLILEVSKFVSAYLGEDNILFSLFWEFLLGLGPKIFLIPEIWLAGRVSGSS